MCGAHIHRRVVIDGDGRPVGVLTALDLVAATVQSIEEATR
jgi:CBS domain-containing protein